MTLPPGPSGRLTNTARFTRAPLAAPTEWYARYGDPFTIRAVNGDVVMTASPDRIRSIFGADPGQFLAFAPHAIAPLTGPGSLLVLDGERHRGERKLLMPPFHGTRMRAYAELMAEIAARRFTDAAARGPFEVQRVAQAVSLDVILRAVLGLEPAAIDAVAKQIVETVDGVSPLFLFFPFLQRRVFGLSPWARHQARYAALDRLLQARIDTIRAEGGGEDILSLMLEARYEDGSPMSDDHIKDELRTLVIAGHETTALAITWAIDAIHRHPRVQAKLLAELDDAPCEPEQWSRLPYLDLVAKETLRLYPVLTEVIRTLRAPWTFAGYDLPAGVSVAAGIQLTHYRPDLYPEPLEFRPERFAERKYSPFEYLAFGGGHRRCIGAAFAGFELRVVLGAVLRGLDFSLVEPEPPGFVRRNITLAPKGGVPVHARRRELASAA